ncbi:NTP transferase domain-containing protein [Erwinia aphidicola]|jgi:choline kinase|uniref:NTP transferase domain-containing protein n=1 Tax=Erwinia aphidicola TaxID=68334 RepID=A0ABU8DJ80_ERWAP|nr:NTP transferase domain-containing protein [uncultured Erwinia sp.]
MSSVKNAVISAAGIGSRLGLNLPKCLIEIAGKSLLQYHFERLTDIENVWLVVGFQEEAVINEAKKIRPDCIIVRNPDYMNTNTLQSIWRVARHLKEKFLIIDADTLIQNESFEDFISKAKGSNHLIGVSSWTTHDGVRTNLDKEEGQVISFTRELISDYEWTGIAIVSPFMIINEKKYVYEALENFLPISSFKINAFDIDTIEDLDMAKKVMTLGWK